MILPSFEGSRSTINNTPSDTYPTQFRELDEYGALSANRDRFMSNSTP
jgi:hypothetical protein